MAIGTDRLFEQCMVVGDGRPYLTALLVLHQEEWLKLAASIGVDAAQKEVPESSLVEEALLERIAPRLAHPVRLS